MVLFYTRLLVQKTNHIMEPSQTVINIMFSCCINYVYVHYRTFQTENNRSPFFFLFFRRLDWIYLCNGRYAYMGCKYVICRKQKSNLAIEIREKSWNLFVCLLDYYSLFVICFMLLQIRSIDLCQLDSDWSWCCMHSQPSLEWMRHSSEVGA